MFGTHNTYKSDSKQYYKHIYSASKMSSRVKIYFYFVTKETPYKIKYECQKEHILTSELYNIRRL